MVTPLYEGCRPEDTRLKVTLMALEMKVKHKMTDACFDVSGRLIHEHLWDLRTEPLSVRRGAKVARRADRGEAHERFYPASEPSREIILLLLLV